MEKEKLKLRVETISHRKSDPRSAYQANRKKQEVNH